MNNQASSTPHQGIEIRGGDTIIITGNTATGSSLSTRQTTKCPTLRDGRWGISEDLN